MNSKNGRDYRYHETLVRDLCNGNFKEVDKLVDGGPGEGPGSSDHRQPSRQNLRTSAKIRSRQSYAQSKQKFIEMGACSAGADNIAQYYSKNLDSPCGKLAKQAVDGNPEAIKELVAFPDYCKWKTSSNRWSRCLTEASLKKPADA